MRPTMQGVFQSDALEGASGPSSGVLLGPGLFGRFPRSAEIGVAGPEKFPGEGGKLRRG